MDWTLYYWALKLKLFKHLLTRNTTNWFFSCKRKGKVNNFHPRTDKEVSVKWFFGFFKNLEINGGLKIEEIGIK